MRFRPLVLAALLLPLLPTSPGRAEGKPDYPPAPRGDVVETMHGEAIADPYRWTEDDDAPEVVAFDEAQLGLVRKRLDAWPERDAWRQRIAKELDLPGMRSLPTFEGGRMWFTRRPEGANHAVLYVTDEDDTLETPRVVLDPNTWSTDGTAGMGEWFVSPTGSHVAYLRDEKGSEDMDLLVRDVVTGKDLPERITRCKFTDVTWDLDGKGFFYNRLPDAESVPAGQEQYHRRIFHHRLGDMPWDDVMIYGRGRPQLEWRGLYRSSDEKHLFLVQGMPWQDHETWQVELVSGGLVKTPIVTGMTDRTWVDRIGDTFLLNSDRHSDLRELYTAPVTEDGTPGDWTKLELPRSATAVLDEIAVVDNRYVVALIREDVISRLYIRLIDGSDTPREVRLPAPGTVRGLRTRKGDTRLWFGFQSYSVPYSTWVVDLATPGKASPDGGLASIAPTQIEQMPTTIDVDNLVTERVRYKSKDGTEIPVFLLRRKDVAYGGSTPLVLYGYGGFRVGLYPGFSKARALWAERGGVYAIACLRGGDEFGESWHEQGCLENKQNVFDDFIAVADGLVADGKVDRSRLAIEGGSNGGLLVAAVIAQRPDLCRAVLCGVPLIDMLRFHRFQFAKSWTKEYGDPDDADAFPGIRAWSPYHNLKPAAYPAVLVTSGLEDGRVNTFHARKLAAALQYLTTSDRPILLRVDRDSGHGSASLKQYKEELLDEHAFLAQEIGRP